MPTPLAEELASHRFKMALKKKEKRWACNQIAEPRKKAAVPIPSKARQRSRIMGGRR